MSVFLLFGVSRSQPQNPAGGCSAAGREDWRDGRGTAATPALHPDLRYGAAF
ncbi:hypothetical protein [uncultured Ruegeria sp.]|uniref:hypothetical protein n=1 Tax=uncultured Ruegeria sp. TaxID=259304 RepID=UPI002624BE89|nr:hypothetical protein [uncultured Ruegeria sp.]